MLLSHFIFGLLFCVSSASYLSKDDADIGMSVGDSAATKVRNLVRSAMEYQLRSPHLIKLKLQSAEDVWFHDVVKLNSKNRVSIGSLNVRFPSDKIIEAEARHLSLNSSTLVNDASLPLFFLDRKNVVVDVEVKHAFLQLRVEQPASLFMENCSIELKNVNFGVERTYLLNTVLNAFGKTLSNGMIRDKVCDMLQIAVVHLRREFSIELPFKMLIPDKFIRHLQNDRVILRSRINSITAVANQIAVTVVMEWKVDEVPTTAHTSLDDTDGLHFNETEIKKLQNDEEKTRQNGQK
uniref:BPI1 domain-containing protein n=1 Tax=Meloidogyne hapla TaxID=6305 RepID=A0A1I8BWG3_MELHA